MSDVVLRLATAADAPEIARIYNQSVTGSTATFDLDTHTAEERAEWLASHGPRHPVVIAEVDGAVAGWGSLSPWNDRGAYADTVEISAYVDEACARRGVGRALDTELLRLAVELGHHAVIAQVSSENSASVALIEQFGFVQVGRLREVGRKFDRWLDVLVFERLL